MKMATTRSTNRNALRASLRHEDAALEQRLPTSRSPRTAAKPATKPAAKPEAQPAAKSSAKPAMAKARATEPPEKPAARPAAGKTTASPARKPTASRPVGVKAPAAKTAVATAPAKAATRPATQSAAKPVTTPASRSRPTSGARAQPGNGAAPAAPKAEPVKAGKILRDSFSIPVQEQKGLKALRQALEKAGRKASKSEVLRAGLALLATRPVAEIAAMLDGLPKVIKGGSKKKRKN
jgi:Arc/MetJ-type ribon-helix-helix transcriptional regulator